jgi:hypothetical protein
MAPASIPESREGDKMLDVKTAVNYAAEAYTRDQHNVGGTNWIVDDTPDGVAIFFRGTEFDFEDILRDIRGLPWWDRKLGFCHSGFLKGARKAFDKPHSLGGSFGDMLCVRNRSVTLGGHSLGGALALVFGAMMTSRGWPPNAIYAFGAPKVQYGRRVSKILENVPVFEFKHDSDIVTTVPAIFARHIVATTQLPFVGDEDDGPFRAHRIRNYQQAIDVMERLKNDDEIGASLK